MPYVIEKTVSNIGAVATPLGLMALGASFDVQKALGKIKPVIAACMLKLVGFTAVFLPFAVMLGFRREELIENLVILGSSKKFRCYGMEK